MSRAVRLAAALALVAVVASAAIVSAEPRRGWELLGERTVTDALDHDTIVVTAVQGSFRRLQFKVFERAVQFHKVIVHFANGEDQELVLRDRIPAGGKSRPIDVAGGDRVIRSIELSYDAQSLGGKAVVRVFGLN